MDNLDYYIFNQGLQMKIIILISIFLLIGVNTKLLYLFSMVRHGAIYPKNNLYDGNETSQYKGQLTTIGMRQQFNLGSYLKQNYITQEQLISPKFNPNQVEFYSSTYQRAQLSALSFIYGFYPLGQGWTIPEEVPSDKLLPPYTPLFTDKLQSQVLETPFALNKGFQPVPVRPLDSILDDCPNYNNLISLRYLQIGAFLDALQNKQSATIAKMRKIFNLTYIQATVPVMSDLYQTLQSDRYLGRALPSDYNETDEKNLKYIYEEYNALVQGGKFANTMITPTLRMLRAAFDGALTKTSNRRFTSIHGHASNIFPLISQLNLTSPDCITEKYYGSSVASLNCVDPPHFAANIIFELHEDDSFEHFVKIRYNGNYAYLCDRKDTKCLYEDFVTRIKKLEVNFEQQCSLKESKLIMIDS